MKGQDVVDPAQLQGLTALVTGASSGLGLHFGELLARRGANVVLGARRIDRLQESAAAIKARGGAAVATALDVTNEESVASAFNAAESAFGPVHILINNAGINHTGLATDIAIEDFDAMFAVNVRGAFSCAREMARRAFKHDMAARGRIVNIASIGAQRVLPGLAGYCASKAALVMLTRALAREWARTGLCVNAICPGYIETDINADWLKSEGGARMVQGFARRRVMRATDLDESLLFLASPASSHITGSIFTLDDGQTL
jgi:NAD(P)-dependent dehydrogenase (short-subunit alcohol dehydrogenase family)